MKRIISTIALTLPLLALCALPKPASADPPNYTHPPTIYPYNQGNGDNHQSANGDRDDHTFNNGNPYVQKTYNRFQRRWIAAHYEKLNYQFRWVPGHYVYW